VFSDGPETSQYVRGYPPGNKRRAQPAAQEERYNRAQKQPRERVEQAEPRAKEEAADETARCLSGYWGNQHLRSLEQDIKERSPGTPAFNELAQFLVAAANRVAPLGLAIKKVAEMKAEPKSGNNSYRDQNPC
jgi:hypothetical protein